MVNVGGVLLRGAAESFRFFIHGDPCSELLEDCSELKELVGVLSFSFFLVFFDKFMLFIGRPGHLVS